MNCLNNARNATFQESKKEITETKNIFLCKRPPPKLSDSVDKFEKRKDYSTNILPSALRSFSSKRKHIDEVYSYCTAAFENAQTSFERKEIETQTKEYLNDIATALSEDVNNLATKLDEYVDMQLDTLGEIPSMIDAFEKKMIKKKKGNADFT
mmetsp:Transcript_1398/g.1842  ORF Transcript_1398/g.1842 Transcript_1398/m.1842 type:complete len:153 (+) Transcript_1398:101-559(+)